MFVVLTDNGHAYALRGERTARFGSAERKLGPWGGWHWDGSELTAEVDRYGFYPLFYAHIPRGVAVGDSLAELLRQGVSPAFDDPAVAAFLRLGFFVGEDTPFAAIRTFPIGGRLTWSRSKGMLVTGADPSARVPVTNIQRTAAVDEYVLRFRAAIGRCLPLDPQTTVLPLSGGRDSRHIALELHRLGFQPGLVISQRHFASRSDDDARVATDLCRSLGWPLVVEAPAGDPAASEIEKNRRFDCLSDEHGWFLTSARKINCAKAAQLFDGIAGDALSNGLFVRKPWIEAGRAGRFQDVLDSLPSSSYYGATEVVLDHLLAPGYRQRWTRAAARERVWHEFEKFTNDDNPWGRFFFWNRTRREIAPFMIRYLPNTEVLTPYLDFDVFDFLWNLPTNFFQDHRFHDDAIAKAAPAFAHIPFATGGSGPGVDTHAAALLRGMARQAMFWRGMGILNQRWLRPRMAAALLSERHARSAEWYGPSWAIWLASLEQLAATHAE